jgi:preprotein translocase subunit SecA
MSFLTRIFSFNEREVARYRRVVEGINALEPRMRALPDRELLLMTPRLKARLAQGESLDQVLPEAYAVAREAARRVLGERPFDVQLIGAIALHEGRISEMKTGEGKTLTATMPLYLNALVGRGSHLVTTNDYLVRWQAEWMGRLYQFLGLTVGFIQHDMPPWVRREMYRADVTYMQNSELGFDYLRDNMALDREHLVQRDLYFAIVDEVDSILIDEARTPLILSGAGEDSTDLYRQVNAVIARLAPGKKDEDKTEHGDYIVDEKMHAVHLTEVGQAKVEKALGVKNIADQGVLEIQHHVQAALKAHTLFHRDKEYIVKDGEVIIVDEFTGHLQPGRRYSDGIHQAIEAKEGVTIRQEQQTAATITYQNFFRLYEKLAGMTGTAKTEEAEFQRIYSMPVIVIPPNRPVRRVDHPDVVYKTQEAKFRGIVSDVLRAKALGQPVLVGTRNVDVSEVIARRLLSDKAQLLALVAVCQDDLLTRKDLNRADRDRMIELLRQPLDEKLPTGTLEFAEDEDEGAPRRDATKAKRTLSLAQAQKCARELGLEADPLHPTNLDRLLAAWDIAPREATLEERATLAAQLGDVLRDDKAINPLNAKFHAQEADVIREAGRAGMVTIATNMAGRGVDIRLGGAPLEGEDRSAEYDEVKGLGGLHVIGTERHESRRIDNQLRGRSGRQGDPGSSRFYVSLEDELMRIFAPERMRFLTGGWPEEEPLATRLMTRSLARAQHKVEMRNFGIRKHTLNYDNVMNEQRTVVYANRRRVLMGEDVRDSVVGMIERVIDALVTGYSRQDQGGDEWDLEGLCGDLRDAIPGLVERLAVEAVLAEIAQTFPHALGAAAEARLGEEREWIARLLERTAREAASSVERSAEGAAALLAEVQGLAYRGRVELETAVLREAEDYAGVACGALRRALEDAAPTLASQVEGLRVDPPADPIAGELPDLQPACEEAAALLRAARTEELRSLLDHLQGGALSAERRDALVAAVSPRLRAAEQVNGLAAELAADGLGRTVTAILTERARQLYDEELLWHERAVERRVTDAIRVHANPEAELTDWDLEALNRDAEQIAPGAASLPAEVAEGAEAHEYPDLLRRHVATLAGRRDPAQAAQRLEALRERVAAAVRTATPARASLHRWTLEPFFQRAGEAEGDARAALADDALRRVRASRLGSELKDPAADLYAQRALAVRGSWGLRRALAMDALRGLPAARLRDEIKRRALALHALREERLGEGALRHLERMSLLRAIEASWPQHLQDMDHLREAVHLRAYGQWDPLVQYQKESYEYFQRLLDRIAQDVTKLVYGTDFVARPTQRRLRRAEPGGGPTPDGAPPATADGSRPERPAELPRPDKRCWCGSGRKYRNCHMTEDQAALAR